MRHSKMFQEKTTGPSVRSLKKQAEYEKSFNLLRDSKYWHTFKAEVTSLISMSDRDVDDVKQAPTKILITKEKLSSYSIKWANKSYAEAYVRLAEGIRKFWNKHLKTALTYCNGLIEKDKNRYKNIVDTLLDAIIKTYSSHKLDGKLESVDGLLGLEVLPAEVIKNITAHEKVAYKNGLAELEDSIKDAHKKRAINQKMVAYVKIIEPKPKLDTDQATPSEVVQKQEIIPEELMDRTGHFVHFTELVGAFCEYITNEKEKKISAESVVMPQLKDIFNGFASALEVVAREKKHTQILPKNFSETTKVSSCYFSKEYLKSLFEIFYKKIIDDSHSANEINVKVPAMGKLKKLCTSIVKEWIEQAKKDKKCNNRSSEGFKVKLNPTYGRTLPPPGLPQ